MRKFVATFVSTLFITCVAFAQSAIDFDAPLIDLDGKPFQVPMADGKTPENLTLGMAAIIAINNQEKPNSPTPPEKKYKDGLLAQKIYKKKVTLTVEEIASLKEAIGKQFGPLVILSAYKMLDPALAEKEAKK